MGKQTEIRMTKWTEPCLPPCCCFCHLLSRWQKHLGVAEFDRGLIPCETACQDEWQLFVALWDDHVQGKYTKEEKLGGGSTIKFMQQSEISTLVNFSRDRRKTQVWNANWIQCTTQILSKLLNFCFENKCTLSQRWGFQVHPKGQIPGTSEWDASEALQPRFCDQQCSKMFVKSHFMHDTVIRWAMGLSKNNLSCFHLAEGMWNIDCVIYHVNTKLQIKHWSTCQEDNFTIYKEITYCSGAALDWV